MEKAAVADGYLGGQRGSTSSGGLWNEAGDALGWPGRLVIDVATVPLDGIRQFARFLA